MDPACKEAARYHQEYNNNIRDNIRNAPFHLYSEHIVARDWDSGFGYNSGLGPLFECDHHFLNIVYDLR